MESNKVNAYCPECNKELKFHQEFAKRLAMCPHCETIMTIPTHDITPQKQKTRVGKKCPNCFEYNDQKVNRCVYCHEFMGKYELNEICPNCKEEQTPKNKYCCKCGVNMKTGLNDGMVKRSCPRCGMVSSGMESICVVCQTPLDASQGQVVAGNMAKTIAKGIKDYSGWFFMTIMLVCSVYIVSHWQQIRSAFDDSYYGKFEGTLRQEIHQYCAALKYQDWQTISQMTKGDKKYKTRDFAEITGIAYDKKTLYQFVDFKISKIILEEKEATVYGDLTVKSLGLDINLDDKSLNTAKKMTNALEKLKKQSPSEPLHVHWKWQQRAGKWLRIIEE